MLATSSRHECERLDAGQRGEASAGVSKQKTARTVAAHERKPSPQHHVRPVCSETGFRVTDEMQATGVQFRDKRLDTGNRTEPRLHRSRHSPASGSHIESGVLSSACPAAAWLLRRACAAGISSRSSTPLIAWSMALTSSTAGTYGTSLTSAWLVIKSITLRSTIWFRSESNSPRFSRRARTRRAGRPLCSAISSISRV